VAAITATAVGVIHGVLFWVVRQRQRCVRLATLDETQHMLRDVVLNQLAVIRLSLELHGQAGQPESRQALGRVESAIGVIDGALTGLSEESLRMWRARYENHSPGP
jgi:hypothetical protein